MWGFRLLRAPPPLLRSPPLAVGEAPGLRQAGAMESGGVGARSSRPAEGLRMQLCAVPGADPQRSNELLLLATAARGGPGDPAVEQHHVLYFPGDVQVTGRGEARLRGGV